MDSAWTKVPYIKGEDYQEDMMARVVNSILHYSNQTCLTSEFNRTRVCNHLHFRIPKHGCCVWDRSVSRLSTEGSNGLPDLAQTHQVLVAWRGTCHLGGSSQFSRTTPNFFRRARLFDSIIIYCSCGKRGKPGLTELYDARVIPFYYLFGAFFLQLNRIHIKTLTFLEIMTNSCIIMTII